MGDGWWVSLEAGGLGGAAVRGRARAYSVLPSANQVSMSSHARLLDMLMPRAAAEIEPVSRMLSKSGALPEPERTPEARTMLSFSRAMRCSVPLRPRSAEEGWGLAVEEDGAPPHKRTARDTLGEPAGSR